MSLLGTYSVHAQARTMVRSWRWIFDHAIKKNVLQYASQYAYNVPRYMLTIHPAICLQYALQYAYNMTCNMSTCNHKHDACIHRIGYCCNQQSWFIILVGNPLWSEPTVLYAKNWGITYFLLLSMYVCRYFSTQRDPTNRLRGLKVAIYWPSRVT